jgi:4-aminobutyrate aminotransferase-like enzyme
MKAPDMVLAQTVKHIALSCGLILGEAGYRMNVLKVKPPLILTLGEADEALSIFESSVKSALLHKRSGSTS